MPRFRCNNLECDNASEELIPHVKFIWNNDTNRLEADEATCPTCGLQRDVVQEEGPIKMPWFKAENARNYRNKTISKKLNEYNY